MKVREDSVLEIVINKIGNICIIEYVDSYLFKNKITVGDDILNWFDNESKEKLTNYLNSNHFSQRIQIEINKQKYWLQLQHHENGYRLILSLYKGIEQTALLNNLSFQLLDLVEEGVIVVDQLGCIVYVNDAFCCLSKYSSNSLVGKMFYPLFVNSDQYNNEFYQLYQDSIVSLDGAIIPVNIVQHKFVLSDNQLVTVYVVKNISLLKKAETQLTLKDQILESLYFASQQFLCSDKWDENIQAVLENLGQAIYACKIKIYENHLQNDEELCMKLYAEWNNNNFKQNAFANKTPIPYFPFYEEIFLELSKGNIYFVDSEEKNNFYRKQNLNQSAILLPINVNNQWWGVFCVEVSQPLKIWNTQEVRALKQVATIIGAAIRQHQLSQQQHQLMDIAEKNNLLKTAFLSNISHEFRTPLNAIIGFSEIIKKSDLSEEKFNEYIQHITENSYRLLSNIDNLIEFSKLEAGTYNLNEEKVNIQKLLTEIGYLTQKKILKSGKKISVKIYCSNNEWEICSDRKKIQQIFEHLIDNAIKFTHKGYIEIGCKKKDDAYHFFVLDTGIGIDEKYHKIILDVFNQIENEKTRSHLGMGLGLAIVKKSINVLNGKISVQSSINQGTTFFFELPAKMKQLEKNEMISKEEPEAVLVYDEDDEMYAKLYSLLKQKYVNVQRIRRLDDIPASQVKCLIVNTSNSLVKNEVKLLSQKYPNLKVIHHCLKNYSQPAYLNSKISSDYYWNIFCKIKNQI